MHRLTLTDYFHKGDQVATGVANQGQPVDLSSYGYCDELTVLQRLEIDLEHAQERVRAIERQIAGVKRAGATI